LSRVRSQMTPAPDSNETNMKNSSPFTRPF
jgi:hypothetical protein